MASAVCGMHRNRHLGRYPACAAPLTSPHTCIIALSSFDYIGVACSIMIFSVKHAPHWIYAGVEIWLLQFAECEIHAICGDIRPVLHRNTCIIALSSFDYIGVAFRVMQLIVQHAPHWMYAGVDIWLLQFAKCAIDAIWYDIRPVLHPNTCIIA
jgi:hypothetical protein